MATCFASPSLHINMLGAEQIVARYTAPRSIAQCLMCVCVCVSRMWAYLLNAAICDVFYSLCVYTVYISRSIDRNALCFLWF